MATDSLKGEKHRAAPPMGHRPTFVHSASRAGDRRRRPHSPPIPSVEALALARADWPAGEASSLGLVHKYLMSAGTGPVTASVIT